MFAPMVNPYDPGSTGTVGFKDSEGIEVNSRGKTGNSSLGFVKDENPARAAAKASSMETDFFAFSKSIFSCCISSEVGNGRDPSQMEGKSGFPLNFSRLLDKAKYNYGGGDGDSIVPVQSGETKKHHHGLQHQKLDQIAMEYETSNGGYGCTYVQIPAPIDRKARVLRYMEKKKRRKFVKTTRYESRKAYAEIRPRIKGRFAKRTNVGVKVEQIFSTTLTTEGGHCIVPSFTI
ncbi:unnamed protein product [Lactuca virosa]|uniref:CCT domain-containing protein n=1 Tax=Lactuca virosa TaxID=75947 RepID=A0AAU9M440_9ASTR|nr:unnamed protein product [Lactuca virosa]